MKSNLFFIFFFIQSYLSADSISEVISKRGIYKHRADIMAEPEDGNDAILKITTDHVFLDLQGYCLTQQPGNVTPGLVGIEIGPNVEDIVIKNGTILQLTGPGIRICDGAKAIRLENFVIDGCHAGGILVEGLTTGTGVEKISIENCIIFSCTGANGGPAQGISINSTNNFRIKGCSCLENDAQMTSSGFGCVIESSKIGKIVNCTMQNIGGDFLAAGCYISSSSSIFIDNCFAMHTTGRSFLAGSFAAGFYVQNSDNIIVTKCQSLENISLEQSSYGFNFTEGTGNILRECIAESNCGSSLAAGIQFAAEKGSIIESCLSSLNKTSDSGTAYGIYLAGTANDHCYIAENKAIGNRGVFSSRGIEDSRALSSSFFHKNRAFDNGTNYVVNYPAGITLPLVTGSLTSSVPGLPVLQAGELENIDINS